MKLVEILARELKEWPESVKGITQSAIDGELYFDGPEFIGSGIFLRPSQDCVSVVTRSQWQEARDALNKPAVEEWNGEGLPPVGTVCERLWSSARNDYVQVRVLAHDKGQAIFRFISGERIDEVQADTQGVVSTGGSPTFRPIRTPEQIAAEERDKAVIEMASIINKRIADIHAAEDLYDAGYRKQEQP